MENFNTVPSQGKYGDSIAVVNENFIIAQQKMEMLQALYHALSGKTQPVVGPLPASGVENTIYRVPGTNSYTEWMWDGTQFVKMDEHDNAIDSVVSFTSDNLVKNKAVVSKISEATGFVGLRNGSSGNRANPNMVTTTFIPSLGRNRFKVVISRPNLEGYRYRIGYCITNSTDDLYTERAVSEMAGYRHHRDAAYDESTCEDHVVESGWVFVGISFQIDEVSKADSTVVNPLRITDFENYPIKVIPYVDDELYIYSPTSSDFVVEEGMYADTASSSIFIHNTKLVARSKNSSFGRAFTNNAALAEELGVNLVTAPSGAENCIEIGSLYCLVFSRVNNKYCLKERYDVADEDELIVACVDGKVVFLRDELLSTTVFKQNTRLVTDENAIAALKTASNVITQFRNGSAGNPGNTKVVTSIFVPCGKGLVKINVSRPNTSGYRYLYGYVLTRSLEDVGTTRSVSQMSGYLAHSDSDIASANCDKDVVDISSNACVGIAIQIREVLIEDYEAYKNGAIPEEDVRYNEPFLISEFDNYFISLKEIGESDVEEDLTKAEEFNVMFMGTTGDVEPFLFFSDPHFYHSYDSTILASGSNSAVRRMLTHYKNTATNFVLCGGDWLTAHKKSIATKILGQIDGWMNSVFDKYYPVYGNHDNNYQGELDTTDDRDANDGALTNREMTNLWFRQYGKMYYSFDGTSTKFYVFDSGLDWSPSMSDYRWEQVDWLAQNLLSNNDTHIVLVTHIASINSTEFQESTPMADNLTKIAQAFNSRTSITLNGQTYNFSGKSGKVHCLLCGHVHSDHYKLLNNIPMYCITTAMDGTFDLVLLDYAAGKLKTVRVGTGSNREMTLA